MYVVIVYFVSDRIQCQFLKSVLTIVDNGLAKVEQTHQGIFNFDTVQSAKFKLFKVDALVDDTDTCCLV